MVGAADHVGDSHLDIVDDVRKVIRRALVGAQQNEVLDVLGLERDVTVNDVVDHDRLFGGDFEPHRVRQLFLEFLAHLVR